MWGNCPAEIGEGDYRRIIEDMGNRPSSGAITRMCRRLKIEEDDFRTINKEDAWEYFYELLAELSAKMARKDLYESLASYLNSEKIDEHMEFIDQQHRKTA